MKWERKKKSKKKVKIKPEDYDGYQLGPIKLERIGREVKMSFDPTKRTESPEEFNKRVLEIRPELREEITNKVTQIINQLTNSNPLHLLSIISIKNLFGDPEEYSESTFEGKEAYVEYINSIALGIDKFHFENDPKFDLKEFIKLIEEVLNNSIWFFASELSEGKYDPHIYELRFNTLIRYIFVRGESYQLHHYELLKELFAEHETFLKENFHFGFNEIWDTLIEIVRQITNNINAQKKYVYITYQLYEEYKIFLTEHKYKYDPNNEEIKKQFKEIINVKKLESELEGLKDNLVEVPFELSCSSNVNLKFLEMLSSTFGENKDFIEFKKSPGWPTNNSIIYDKPIIKYEEKYYAFAFTILYRKLRNIIEGWIFDVDKNYYDRVYQNKRGKLLEISAVKYLSKMLPGCISNNNLYYYIDDNKNNRFECDGLIQFDSYLFIIEAKSSSLSIPARRGGIKSLLDELKIIMDEAYEQAIRTKKFIINSDQPTFYDEHNNIVLVLDNKVTYREIFIINVTLEEISPFSTYLPFAKILNLIQGKEFPWSVFINDLRIISEIIEFPSEFILYLQRRINSNKFPQFRAFDEQDYFMWFLNEGLYFDESNLQSYAFLTPSGYTEELDRYYSFLDGKVSSGSKPKFILPEEYQNFIQRIEKLNKPLVYYTSTTLLGVSGEGAKDILNRINELLKIVSQDHQEHNITLFFKDFGFTFSVLPYKESIWQKIDAYCELKMYQLKFNRWFFLSAVINDNDYDLYENKVYEKEWKYNEELEIKVNDFKKKKLLHVKQEHIKIGRNDPCPCGSGKKFKYCCL